MTRHPRSRRARQRKRSGNHRLATIIMARAFATGRRGQRKNAIGLMRIAMRLMRRPRRER